MEEINYIMKTCGEILERCEEKLTEIQEEFGVIQEFEADFGKTLKTY